ncbi:MAG: Trk system potassium transporter TrkA [Bacteroidota bacterium]
MKITIAGAGEVGTHLAEMLSKEKHDIIVIDNDVENITNLESHYDILTISGSCTSFANLSDARASEADLFIAVTKNEETNLISAMIAKKMGAKQTIARIDNREYLFPTSREHFRHLGIDTIICPEKLAANEIVGLIHQSGLSELFEFSGGKLLLTVVRLDDDAPIINHSLIEASAINPHFDYRAVAITRNEKTIIPRGSDMFLKNDLVYVITNQAGVQSLLTYAGKVHYEISNIMILGGSRIGMKTAKDLENRYNIKMIESSKERCLELSDILQKSLIINGDVSDIHLMMDEGLKKMDAFIAVTESSETNILSCLYAKKMGVKKTIAEVENIDYIDLAENIGIEAIINKKLISASYIYRFTMNAKVEASKCLTGADAEVFEFVVQDDTKITKSMVKDLNFPEGAIIGGVIRKDQSFIVKGDTHIQAHDKVVVFSLPSAIKKVDKFFNI